MGVELLDLLQQRVYTTCPADVHAFAAFTTFPAVLYISITGSEVYRVNKVVTARGALIHISAAEAKRSASKLATITLNIVIFQTQQDLRFHE